MFSLRAWATVEKYWDVYFELMTSVREELAADGVVLTYGAKRVVQ